MYIELLQAYRQQLSTLEREINQLVAQLEEYELIQSLPGIGEKIAATILSEIGEIERFNHPKKLVAFAGLDPVCLNQVALKARKITLPNAARSASFATCFTWPSAVQFEIVVKRKQQMKPLHEINDYGPSTI